MYKTFILFIISLNSFAQINNPKALKMALDDEYKALATYSQVLEDFGETRPFSNIMQSEQRHIEALLPFFQKYNLEIPPNKYLGKMDSYQSIEEACLAGIDAEIENVSLYDTIYAITDDKSLIKVFNRLQSASQNKHLRAFKRCSKSKKD